MSELVATAHEITRSLKWSYSAHRIFHEFDSGYERTLMKFILPHGDQIIMSGPANNIMDQIDYTYEVWV